MSGKIKGKYCFDEALDASGFGKYNYYTLITCCLLILTMYVDIFGFSVLLPTVACDFGLSNTQQGLLSAIPFVGVMLSSYAWGFCADTQGRRKILLIAMPIGSCFSFFTSIAPEFISFSVLKFFSACFLSSANAAGFVLLGESVPNHHRNQFMFLMASATMIGQLAISIPALVIFHFTFHIEVPWLNLIYRPWRLLLQTMSISGLLVALAMLFLEESPKFLLSKGHEDRALKALKYIYKCNTGNVGDSFPVSSVYLEELEIKPDTRKSPIQRVWDQTAPLFKPPLLKNSLILYFILLCCYVTSTGFTMWAPTITNAYFNGHDNVTGLTLCEVASNAARRTAYKNTTSQTALDCDNVIKPNALYAVMVYSGVCGLLNMVLTFVVGPLGKKKTTLLIITMTVLSGCSLLFVRIPMLSIALFFLFAYICLILGNINTYLVELNPTYLRGMATSLSVMVARGVGFISVQLIATFMAERCTQMVTSYIVLGMLGLITAFFLPPDEKKTDKALTNTKLSVLMESGGRERH